MIPKRPRSTLPGVVLFGLAFAMLAVPGAFAQSCTVSAPGVTLSWFGTASSGGFLPETPQTIALMVTGNCGTLTATVPFTDVQKGYCGQVFTTNFPAMPWLLASVSGDTVTFTALTNPGLSSRTGTIVIGSAAASPTTITVTEAGQSEGEPTSQLIVRGLYQTILGRDPDAAGFAFWTGAGGAELGQMADSFLTAPESFNTDFAVLAAYQAATGAPPTYAQFITAVSALVADEQTISGLYVSLLGANNAATPSAIESLYMNLLNRQPAPPELASAETNTLAQTFAALIGYPATLGIAAPIGSAANEFQSTGGFQTDHTNLLYITLLYFTLLNRDPDPGGLAFWVGQANNGGPGILFQGAAGYSTRIQILGTGVRGDGFLGSSEFTGPISCPIF